MTARYIAPESIYLYPIRLASSFAIVLLPDDENPSMAIMICLSLFSISIDEIVDVETQVHHKCRGSGVWLRECYPESEFVDIQAGAERPSRQETAGVSAHVRARLIVVCECYVEFVRWREIGAEYKVPEQVRAERVLFRRFGL